MSPERLGPEKMCLGQMCFRTMGSDKWDPYIWALDKCTPKQMSSKQVSAKNMKTSVTFCVSSDYNQKYMGKFVI